MSYHNQIDRDCYVYRHIRLDKNVPFYIGIGKVYDYRPEDYYWKYLSDYKNKAIIAKK